MRQTHITTHSVYFRSREVLNNAVITLSTAVIIERKPRFLNTRTCRRYIRSCLSIMDSIFSASDLCIM
ncbi:DUF1363 domain-containing protein, partial [Salmonella enterica subsp. enterica serovar Typhimurium]